MTSVRGMSASQGDDTAPNRVACQETERIERLNQNETGGFYLNIFEIVKAAVTVRDAAEHYGLKVGRNGMACCPFHNDQHPSMKLNEDYFYCFGCGAKGDVIDFVARLFDLNSYEAVQKLAYDFGIDPDKPPAAAAVATATQKSKYPLAREFQKEELYYQRVFAPSGTLEGAVCTQDTRGNH